MAPFDALVLIRGAGALGSGVAYRLVKAGFPVVMTELANPLVLRSTVSYGPCIYYHSVIVEGIVARHAEIDQVQDLQGQDSIPVLIDPRHAAIAALRPAVVIDARGRYVNGDTTINDAPLVIGLGQGFSAGTNCHAVIETQRGHNLGRVLWRGSAATLTIDFDNPVYSPADGLTLQFTMIGEQVSAGGLIARVGNVAVHAPVDGILSGLIDNDIQVTAGTRIGIVKQDIRREDCFTISSRALAVGGGVLESILSAPQIANYLGAHPDVASNESMYVNSPSLVPRKGSVDEILSS